MEEPESTTTGPAPVPDPFPHDIIAEIAQALWEEAGKPEGEDLRFWYEAEAVLRREASSIGK